MAPKPDQMQLEKQKNAEIQRTQQAAEQTQNMQQPVQQNEQTQQNAQQFWTEEMALQELIPMQSENLSQEMKNAYENAHGQRMGVKTRIWRTERTTKKKREKSNALRAADARYAHNRQILEEKYAIREQLKDVNAPFQSAVKTWLDLSGTESGEASNQTMLNNLKGKRDAQKEAIKDIKKKINGWKLQDYQDLDERQIIDRYYDIKDKIEKAKAYKAIYDHGISIGQSSSADYEAELLAKVEYFIRLEPYIQARHDLITSPYYSLLRKEDLNALSDEQLMQRQEQAGGNMQSFYRAVYMLRNTRADAQALMADPASFTKEQAKNLLQEAKQMKEQAQKNDNHLNEEEQRREVEQYERDRKARQEWEREKEPERARVLDERRKLSELARDAVQEVTNACQKRDAILDSLSDDVRKKLFAQRDLLAMIEPEMTGEQVRQRFENFASDDPQVRHAEYEKVFERMMNQDLSQFRIATDKDLLYHAGENLQLLNGFIQMNAFMQRALRDKMEIPKERQEKIFRRYSFFCMLSPWYGDYMRFMSETEYGETLPKELPEELPDSTEGMEEVISVRKKEFLDKNQPERARRWGQLLYAYFNWMNTETNTESRQIDRTKTVQELWENYKTEEELVAQEKAERKALIEPAKKAKADWEAKIKKRNEVGDKVPEFKNAKYNDRRYRCLVSPLMPEEEMKQHFRNLASTDEKVRFREYEDAIERMMTFDLSQLEIRTDEQILKHAVENQLLFNQFSQITDLAKAAIAQGMEIPQERRQAIWKRYCFWLDLKALIDSRMTMMQWKEYGECTAGEEPKTREEALDKLAMAQKTLNTDKINFYAGISAGFVAGKKALNRKKTVQELWDSYQAPEMDEELKAAKPA